MHNPTPPVSARLARFRWISLLNLAVSVVFLPFALLVFIAFPSVVTGLLVPVAVYGLYVAVGSRRSYKRSAAVWSLVAAHKASHEAARASAR